MWASLCKNVTISFVCALIISCEQRQPEIPQLSFEEEIQQRLIQLLSFLAECSSEYGYHF